jgi:hypothetical protein
MYISKLPTVWWNWKTDVNDYYWQFKDMFHCSWYSNHWKLQSITLYNSTWSISCIFHITRRTVSCGSMFVLVYWIIEPNCYFLAKVVAWNSLDFHMVVLFHILDSMNLSSSGFRENSYFKRLKTQSKITASYILCCSHISVTFVLNFLPVCPVLCPKPLNIYFSCYHNSEVKIQHTI